MNLQPPCPICSSTSELHDVVDFSRNCHSQDTPLCGVPIYYAMCTWCNFCFAPELHGWSIDDFSEWIYNADYASFDPDYLGERPRKNAHFMLDLIPEFSQPLKHLDYGGGHGLLSQTLAKNQWDSKSYDPFVDRTCDISCLGNFQLITAFEVFEHAPDCHELMRNLAALLSDDGIVILTTLLSDQHLARGQRMTWWYAAPRNGHISLYSRKSLDFLTRAHGLYFSPLNEGTHVIWKSRPGPWAQSLFTSS